MIIKVSIPNRFQLKTAPSFRTVLMPKQGEVHHIGGAGIPPPSLESKEEGRMISFLDGGGDKYTHSSFVEHSLKPVAYIARKFDSVNMGAEDLISMGIIGLIKAINTFRLDRNIKLAIYTPWCAESEILIHLRHSNKIRLEVSIGEPLDVDWDKSGLLSSDILGTDEDMIYRDIEDKIEKNLLNNAINRLNLREREIVELRYGLTNEDGKEMTQKEVADLLDTLQSYISRLERRIMKHLRREIVRFEQAEKVGSQAGFFCQDPDLPYGEK